MSTKLKKYGILIIAAVLLVAVLSVGAASAADLPSGYQEIEYIESTGTQYINTGVIPSVNDVFTFDMQFTSLTSRYQLFGCLATGPLETSFGITNGNKWRCRGVVGSAADTNRHTFVHKITGTNTQTLSVSGVTTYTSTENTQVNLVSNYCLFARDDYGSLANFARCKLYSCKIVRGDGNLIRNFVPVKRVSDSKAGLYDTVTKTFYTDSAGGSFTAGDPVYYVSYNSNGATSGSVPVDSTGYVNGKSATVKSNTGSLAKNGYTFANWRLGSTTGTSYSPGSSITMNSDKTLYASWTPTSYSISYTLNGGTLSSSNPSSYTIESSTFTLKNPTKTGYTFAGWTGTGLSGKTKTVTISKGSTGARSYTANWDVIPEYSITNQSVVNGAVIANKTKAKAGETVNVVAYNTTTGYHFNSWNVTTSTGTISVDVSGNFIMPDSNVNVGANFVANVTNVKFHSDSTVEEKTNTFGSSTNKPADPTKQGYIFAGWNVSTSAGWKSFNSDAYNKSGIWNYAGNHDGTLDVYANWTANYYAVNFTMNGHGTQVDNQSVAYGSTVSKPTDPSESGYRFNGWYTDTGLTSIYDFDMPVTGKLDLYANWTLDFYNIIVDQPENGTISVGLPSGYTEVEYIQSSGTQWINTGVPRPTSSLTVEAEITLENTNIATNQVLTTWYSAGTMTCVDGAVLMIVVQKWGVGDGVSANQSATLSEQKVKGKFVIGSNGYPGSTAYVYVDGSWKESAAKVRSNFPGNQASALNYFVLFNNGNNNNGNNKYPYYGKIKSAKYYENGVLTRNFVPCIRNSDSVIGMYDTVNNEFYTNAGTGTFTAGPIVNCYVGKTINVRSTPNVGYHLNWTYWHNISEPFTLHLFVNSFVMPASDVVVSGDFLANQTIVTYWNDSTQESSVVYTYNETIPIPPTPSKIGYTFNGWNASSPSGTPVLDADGNFINYATKGGKKWDNSTNANATTLVLYANWTKVLTYAIDNTTEVTNGSISLNVTSPVVAGTVVHLTPVNDTGYKEVGDITVHKSGSSETVPVTANNFTMPAYDINVSYSFTPITYNISFNNNSGTGTMDNQVFFYDVEQALSANAFSKPGYAFGGWATESSGPVVYSDQQAVRNLTSEDGKTITLYANWTPQTYSITYWQNDGSSTQATVSVPYGTSTKLNRTGDLAGFTRGSGDGYTFLNWTQYANGTGNSYAETEEVTNIGQPGTTTNLYASWGVNETQAVNTLTSGQTIGGTSYPQWSSSKESPYVVGYDAFDGTVAFGPFTITSGASSALNHTMTVENLTSAKAKGRINVTYQDGGEIEELGSDGYSIEDYDGNGYISLTNAGRAASNLSKVSVVVKEYPLGDANIDEKVDIVDTASVGVFLLKGGGEDVSANIFLPDENQVHGDVNHDGVVDVADMLAINEYLVGAGVLV